MSETRRILVQCTFTIPVEFPSDWTDEMIRFEVETNGCPGTGFVGGAFLQHLEKTDEESMCWACTLKGENKIVGGLLPALSPK